MHRSAPCDLPSEAAAQELRSWWLQEQADARTRGADVAALLADLHEQTAKESPMPTTIPTTTTRTDHAHVASILETGLVRPSQQDAVRIVDLPEGRLLLGIADGFGSDDDLASRLLGALAESLATALADPGEDVLSALGSAWAALPALLPPDGASGAALTAAVLDGDRLVTGHVGDGRVLLVREGRIDPLTRDHTHVSSLVAAGRLTPEEAAADPRRAVLNRALAEGVPTEPDLLVRALAPGDRLVLLTDGVHAVLDQERLGELVWCSPAEIPRIWSRLWPRALGRPARPTTSRRWSPTSAEVRGPGAGAVQEGGCEAAPHSSFCAAFRTSLAIGPAVVAP
ncbi:serine/threonine protein phosphatase [Brachybacterium endophyticum]|uniref:Serine/threonine protein phosphatase n=1 Tax=Brachybacterium endophyticum TaxID=2182385 RepID=A0A2U2RNZ6_9MICO|nr:PP2C family serine/threonine-protein phosphatase [Brachybacterium endophyticum]PWH07484.1 serine/threonine protein phosphatase [Brachybacterium endophyticum]